MIYRRSTEELLAYIPGVAPEIQRFTDQVYIPALRALMVGCSSRGMAGVFDGVMLRSFILAGRVLLTFSDEHTQAQVTIIGAADEDTPRLGLHSCNTGLEHACHLIATMIEAWPDTLPEQMRMFGPAELGIG